MSILPHSNFKVGDYLLSDNDGRVVSQQLLLPLDCIEEDSEVEVHFKCGLKQMWGTEKKS